MTLESALGLESLGDWIRTGGIVALLAVVLNFYLKNKAGDRAGYGNLIPGTRIGAADTDYRRAMDEILGPVGGMASGIVSGADAFVDDLLINYALNFSQKKFKPD